MENKGNPHTPKLKMENKENVLKTKSYDFAIRIVKAYRHIVSETKEFVLSKQLLRAGTSVGANVAEANQGQSKPDFVNKLSISLKEAVETEYWLNLLCDTGFLTKAQSTSLIGDCSELKALLIASIKSSKRNINRG
jgi:four helix bundle protein